MNETARDYTLTERSFENRIQERAGTEKSLSGNAHGDMQGHR